MTTCVSWASAVTAYSSTDLVNWAPVGPALTRPLGTIWASSFVGSSAPTCTLPSSGSSSSSLSLNQSVTKIASISRTTGPSTRHISSFQCRPRLMFFLPW